MASYQNDNKYIQVIPFLYDDVRSFSGGVAAASINDKWGIIDKAGNNVGVIDEQVSTREPVGFFNWDYYRAQNESEGLKLDSDDNGHQVAYFFIDKRTGKIIYVCSKIRGFSEGMAAVCQSNEFWDGFRIRRKSSARWGFIDRTGKEVIELKYNAAGDFHEGLAAVMIGGKWGYIDKTGEPIVSLKYSDAQPFFEGAALIRLNGRYGFINKEGDKLVPIKYEDARSFSEGLAAVKLNGKWGFISLVKETE